MTILRIESLIYGVENLAAATEYFDDWGLTRTAAHDEGVDYRLPSGQTILLRKATDPTLPPPIEIGSTVREIVWGVDTAEALEALRVALAVDLDVTQDADGGVHLLGPWGLPIGLRVADTTPTPLSPHSRVRNTAFKPIERARPLRMGHAVFFVPSVHREATTQFFMERLGFRLTESVKPLGDFLRAAGATDHHNLFLIKAGERCGFDHVAFEVSDFDEIMVGGKYMENKGWPPQTRPGRHIMGGNLFWYFENPAGGNSEYMCDMDVVDDDWTTVYRDKSPGIAHWTMTPKGETDISRRVKPREERVLK